MSTELAHTFTTFEQVGPDGLVLRGIESVTSGRYLELKPVVAWLGLNWRRQYEKITKFEKVGRLVYRAPGTQRALTYVNYEATIRWIERLDPTSPKITPQSAERIRVLRTVLNSPHPSTGDVPHPSTGEVVPAADSRRYLDLMERAVTIQAEVSASNAQLAAVLTKYGEAISTLLVRDDHKGQAIADQQTKLARHDATFGRVLNSQADMKRLIAHTVDRVEKLASTVGRSGEATSVLYDTSNPAGWISIGEQMVGLGYPRMTEAQKKEIGIRVATTWRGQRRGEPATRSYANKIGTYNVYPPDWIYGWCVVRKRELDQIMSDSNVVL